jgi:chromosome segregation ATPase
MREKFEILSKASGWNGSLSPRNGEEENEKSFYGVDCESLSRLVEHVLVVLERREITCVELNRSLERQQLELEASREQVGVASVRLKELRDRLSESESNGIELTGKVSSLQTRVQTQEQALKREKAQATWSAEELQKTLDTFAIFRREQSAQMAECRAQADSAQFQLQESQDRLERCLRSLQERERQVTQLQEQASSLKAQLASNEANFTREMNSTSRMVELYRNASEDASARMAILQAEIEELRESLAAAEAQESGQSADLEAELEDREQVIKVKEEQLEKMRSALDEVLKARGESTSIKISSTSPSKMSAEEIYSEYATCRGKLAQAEEECTQLHRTVQELVSEANLRGPLLETFKADNSRLQADISALTEQLIQAAIARDSVIGERIEFERTIASLNRERETLQQECNDLSQQVQGLLYEIESNTTGNPPNSNNYKRHRPGTENNVVCASEVISENLVDLTSVTQLQQRNQDLLRSLRAITAKYEALEREKDSPHLKLQLEEAVRELEAVHEARKRQAQMVETILKTKAFEGNSGTAVQPTISSMEMEQLRKQLEFKEDSLKRAICEVEESRRELAGERVSRAKLNAQLEMNEERLKMLRENLSQEREENAAMRARISSQVESFNLAQAASHKLLAELSNAQDRETRLHGQVEKLQGDLNGLLVDASRMQAECLGVSGERDRLTSLLNTMQGVLQEHEASESTLKRHFTAQIELMERELEASRARISDMGASHSAALLAVERERSELFKRLEGLSEEISRRKETAGQLESSLSVAREKIVDLERVLQQAASEANQDENVARTSELRVRALNGELKKQNAALQEAQAVIVQLEGQLTELTSVKEALTVRDVQLQEAQAEIEHVRGDCERLEEELTAARNELTEAQGQVSQLSERVETLEVQIKSADESREDLVRERDSLASQLSEGKTLCDSLNSRLGDRDREVKELQTLITDLEGRVRSLQTQNEALLDESQKSVEGEEDLGVVCFLRNEKDKLQMEREALALEVRTLQTRLQESQTILENERGALTAQADDYARLLGEVERLNAAREGGALQQHESVQLRMKMTMMEAQLKEKNSALEPLRKDLLAAQNELEHLRESLASLQSDRDSWKSRFETAVSAAAPDPVELKQAKMQSEMFRQRAIALTKNLSETRAAAAQEIESLNAEIKQLQQAKENFQMDQDEEEEEDNQMEEDEEEEVVVVVKNELEKEDNMNVSLIVEQEQERVDASVSDNESSISSSSTSIYEPTPSNSETTTVKASEDDTSFTNALVSKSEDSVKLIPQSSEESIASILSEEPIIAVEPANQSPAPIVENLVPARKKIVSLAGIVSSNATPAPVMITTASGKKFTPITFPDPPSASSSSTGNNSTSTSPVKSKKSNPNKKTILKKKNKLGGSSKNSNNAD